MKNNELAQYANENEWIRVLKGAVENGENTQIRIQHIKNVRDMLGKDGIFE